MGNSLAIKTCVFGFSVANADSSMENFLTYCNTHKLKNNIFKTYLKTMFYLKNIYYYF